MDKRRVTKAFWRLVNPPTLLLAGRAPWWLIIETTGRRTGRPRRLPLARGPIEGNVFWLLAAHGRHALWVRNAQANPRVRIRHRGRWRTGTATIEPLTDDMRRRFNLYARGGAGRISIDPCLVRVELDA
jgi:deazaflavin-dependent oxidoreductase (nitroreductase family)